MWRSGDEWDSTGQKERASLPPEMVGGRRGWGIEGRRRKFILVIVCECVCGGKGCEECREEFIYQRRSIGGGIGGCF